MPNGLDHRLVQLLAVPASSGLPALILSGQDGLTTHLAANVGEGMIEACLTNKVRSSERSERRSEPFVGRARDRGGAEGDRK